jgi:hypothetical protein
MAELIQCHWRSWLRQKPDFAVGELAIGEKAPHKLDNHSH